MAKKVVKPAHKYWLRVDEAPLKRKHMSDEPQTFAFLKGYDTEEEARKEGTFRLSTNAGIKFVVYKHDVTATPKLSEVHSEAMHEEKLSELAAVDKIVSALKEAE